MKSGALLILITLAPDAGLPARPVDFRGSVSVVDPPSRKRVRMDADPALAALHPGTVYSEDILVDADHYVQGAFVAVRRGVKGGRPAPPDAPAVMAHDKGFFRPRILGMQVGQKIEFRNNDDILHNTHVITLVNREYNFGQPNAGMKNVVLFDQPEEKIRVRCDVHPWELGWVWVLDHPYFALTGPDGRFEIPNLPPGRYTLEAWHERYLPVSRVIEVGIGRPPALHFTLVERAPRD